MKKLLSIVLSLLMICAVLPGGALAQTESDDDIDESPEAFWRGELGKGTIEERGDFRVYVQDDLITLLCYSGVDADVIIPDYINDISEFTKWENKETTVTLTFPQGFRDLGYYNFAGLVNLKEVKLPDCLTRIAAGSFQGCRSLEKVNIPDKVTFIYDYAFSGCSSLKSIDLPEGLERIGLAAFSNTGLTEIIIPESTKRVENAFWNCDDLKKIVVTSPNTELLHFGDYVKTTATIYAPKDSKAEKAAKAAGIPFKAFALNRSSLSLSKGKSYQLKFNSGSDAVWKSSNSKIVSVDQNGKITAKKNGAATITATLYGKKYTCKVTAGAKTYTVKRGDTLWGIAAKQLGSGYRYKEIMKLNGLKSTKIVSGQRLKLPER